MSVPMQMEMLRRFEPVERRIPINSVSRPAVQTASRYFMLSSRSPWLFGAAGSRFNLACADRPGIAVASRTAMFGPPLFSGISGASVLATCDGSTSPFRDEAPATLVPAHNKNALYGRGYWPDTQSVK